jgi:hypothetical protein
MLRTSCRNRPVSLASRAKDQQGPGDEARTKTIAALPLQTNGQT